MDAHPKALSPEDERKPVVVKHCDKASSSSSAAPPCTVTDSRIVSAIRTNDPDDAECDFPYDATCYELEEPTIWTPDEPSIEFWDQSSGTHKCSSQWADARDDVTGAPIATSGVDRLGDDLSRAMNDCFADQHGRMTDLKRSYLAADSGDAALLANIAALQPGLVSSHPGGAAGTALPHALIDRLIMEPDRLYEIPRGCEKQSVSVEPGPATYFAALLRNLWLRIRHFAQAR